MTAIKAVTHRVAFGLGANLGDRCGYLQLAVDMILAEPGNDLVGVSSVYETAPIGGPEQFDYLNAVIVVESIRTPDELLALARRCESSAARVRSTRWGPRTLDVDVLAVGRVQSADPAITLPHPRIRERAFVLKPWADVDPDFTPWPNESVAELLTRVSQTGVRPSEAQLQVST